MIEREKKNLQEDFLSTSLEPQSYRGISIEYSN